MAKPSSNEFLELVKRSRLVEKDQLAQALSEFKEATPEQFDDCDFLAAQLVNRELLTRWQCDKLLEGRHKGFFLGKYKLLAHLGTGQSSAVYLAEHVLFQRRVAIKVLPPSRVQDSSYLARFVQEGQAAAALDHPNIVRVYDIDSVSFTHFLVMEYVEGRDLQSMVAAGGPCDYQTAAIYIVQAATGLHYCHEAGFVHRGIRPSKLLIETNGRVKVQCVGMAKLSNADKVPTTSAREGDVPRASDYLAPEQELDSRRVDRRADVYSLGCTLYYSLTGRPPYPIRTLPQRLMRRRTKEPASISIDRPDAPRKLVEICEDMMCQSPDDRFQTADDVCRALIGWL